MNRRILRYLPCLLAVGLLTLLCACNAAPKPSAPTAVTVSRIYAPQPKEADARLEVDAMEAGTLFQRSDAFYVKADTLCGLWSMPSREEAETLLLGPEDAPVTLRDGANEAQAGDGSSIDLGAPALHCADGWYLPVSALESLWGRTLVWYGTAVLRCFQLEPGPMIWLNGSELEQAEACGGVPVLTAARLAEVSGGSLTTDEETDTPHLTLQAWGHTITFRQGALQAELDGMPTVLPAPAWQTGADWYLPAVTAELLGCKKLEAGENTISLLRTEEGPACWFAGVELEPLQRIGTVLLADPAALAAAAGGKLRDRNGAKVLSALGHVLTLHPGEAQAELDGSALTLPFPAMEAGEGLLVPIEPVAEALGLSRREEDCGLVYSLLTPCETVLWVDGRQTQSYTCPDGGLYVRLADVNDRIGGCFLPTGNEAILQTREGELALEAGAVTCVARGETVSLSAPTLADGTDWYVSAPEVLPALGLFELVDPELDQRYYTHVAKHDKIPRGVRVPVLMYHAVSDYTWGEPELFVSPSVLEAQLQAMLEEGYTAITFEDLDHVDEIDKPVLLTFDDGYDDNYTKLFPLLQKYNVKATVFMIVNDIGKNHKLTLEQIQEMSASGLVSFQSHTMSHGFLSYMYEDQLRREHYDSMVALARITGKQPFVLSYPTGRSSEFSRGVTAEYYEYGLNMTGPCYVTGDEPYEIYRYYISRFTGVGAFLDDLAG